MYPYFRAMFLCLCMMIIASHAGANTVDRIVAVVNGDVILLSELQNNVRLAVVEVEGQDIADPGSRSRLEEMVLKQMIRELLAEQEVKRLNIRVPASEVNVAVASIKRENGFTEDQFEYVLQQQGMSISQFQEDIRKKLERSRLVDRVFKSKTIITDEQVDAHLKSDSRAEVDSREKYRLAILFLPFSSGSQAPTASDRKNAEALLARLVKGENFAELTARYSKGPAAREGGDIGYMAVDELSPDIRTAVGGLEAGEISSLVKGAGGYYILRVLDVRREQVRYSEAEARERMRRELFQQEVTRKFENWVVDLESKAYIDIRL